jgi:nucleoside-diphosphate-sugar epimerase
MVYVDNLVDFLILCIDHPNAANQTFLISDGENFSLKSLITSIRSVMGKPAWLIPIPAGLLILVGKLIGKSGVMDRLIGDLEIDSSKARTLLGWNPPYGVEEAIAATVLDFYKREF